MPTRILGLSAYYHDSAACLVEDGRIVAAAQEERFTRKKHDPDFPANAVAYCLREAGITAKELLAPLPLGIALGLLVGKAVGVFGSSWLMIKLGLARKPGGSSWGQLFGVCVLCGIGFTMSLFIGTLVARLGIPSFVVTLAMFLALQGVMLLIISEGGTIRLKSDVLLAIMNQNMPVWMGWVLSGTSGDRTATTSRGQPPLR